MLKLNKQRKLARRIATALMVNGMGEKAERLQLRDMNEKDLGGLCRDAVEHVIYKTLSGGRDGK